MRRVIYESGLRLACLAGAWWLACGAAWGQSPSGISSAQSAQISAQNESQQSNPPASESGSNSNSNDSLTFFPHSKSSRFWISGQANIVFQWHPSFPAKYTGPNSLRPGAEHAATRIFTLYSGYEITRNTEVFLDVESSGGNGISNTLGLAGYTDLDAVRVGLPSQTPYVARAMIRQVIPLSHERVAQERNAASFTLANTVPVRRIELRAGKFSLPDFFDANAYGSDSHLQFLNWAIDTNGAYDYAANTRGYTDGVIVEYDDHWFSMRFGEALMPKVANGIHLDADVVRARSENFELDFSGSAIAHRAGAL